MFLGIRTGLDQPHISKLENGKTFAGPAVMARLRAAFSDITDEEDQK